MKRLDDINNIFISHLNIYFFCGNRLRKRMRVVETPSVVWRTTIFAVILHPQENKTNALYAKF